MTDNFASLASCFSYSVLRLIYICSLLFAFHSHSLSFCVSSYLNIVYNFWVWITYINTRHTNWYHGHRVLNWIKYRIEECDNTLNDNNVMQWEIKHFHRPSLFFPLSCFYLLSELYSWLSLQKKQSENDISNQIQSTKNWIRLTMSHTWMPMSFSIVTG